MSQENIEVVRRMYEAYTAGDFETALAEFQPDAEVDLSARGYTAVGKGSEGITRVVSSWTESWDEYSERLDEIHDLGDRVLVLATQRGRGKGSGIEVSSQWGFLVELRAGRIARLTAYRDRASALEAAGISEQA
jgi:uncharacterized protein